jgi:SWI/SNF-related matrix-associated actin-dependent regulator of chromatin subfamily A3
VFASSRCVDKPKSKLCKRVVLSKIHTSFKKNRNPSSKPIMPSRGKRALRAGVIDLTGSDEENDVPQRKHPRIGAASSSQLPSTAPTSVRDQWLVGENSEESDIIDLSQDVEEGFGWVCLGAIDGKIVGIRYYNGYATVGEQVMIRREPSNPYDSNAIRINNVQGTQIGHLPRQLAAKLAPYLVSRPFTVVKFSGLIRIL